MLRRQLEAIREELGEGSDGESDDYRERLAEGSFPDAVRAAIERELDKLERTSEQSPEHGWIRSWLDTVFDVPWSTRSDERLDVVEAREILDADHTGLEDVKDRIVEYLAVRKLRAERGTADRRVGPDAAATRRGSDPRPGRPAGCGQDVARRVDCSCPRPEVRAHRARWRARRSGAAWAPPHVRRIAAGTDRARAHRSGHDEPGRRARRGRQARCRLARRPVVGTARGARSRPEPHLPRSLPRGGSRPLRRDVPRDRERPGDDPRSAARPARDPSSRRLHRGREGGDRP